MLALSQDLRQNRPVEAREHVRRFHELFFTYGPEKSAIEGNVNRLIAGGILQTTQVDSVVCDMSAYPYRPAPMPRRRSCARAPLPNGRS